MYPCYRRVLSNEVFRQYECQILEPKVTETSSDAIATSSLALAKSLVAKYLKVADPRECTTQT